MSATNIQAVPKPKVNGAFDSHPNRAAHRRSASKPAPAIQAAPEAAPSPQELANFAVVEIQRIDAQMWPVHPVFWLQPELNPEPPESSGLRIERHNKVPVPGFLDLEIGAGNRSDATQELRLGNPSSVPNALPPAVPHMPPQSDLTPLGWDPRISWDRLGKEGKE